MIIDNFVKLDFLCETVNKFTNYNMILHRVNAIIDNRGHLDVLIQVEHKTDDKEGGVFRMQREYVYSEEAANIEEKLFVDKVMLQLAIEGIQNIYNKRIVK